MTGSPASRRRTASTAPCATSRIARQAASSATVSSRFHEGRVETADGRLAAYSRDPNDEPREAIEPRIEHNDARELEEAAECRHRQHAVGIIESSTHPVCRCRERSEEQDPEHADDHTEDDVRQRRAPHREAAADHHQPGRRRRSDALPDDHRAALLERQRARIQRNQRRRSGGGRALHDDRHEDADPGKDPPRAETLAGETPRGSTKCLPSPSAGSRCPVKIIRSPRGSLRAIASALAISQRSAPTPRMGRAAAEIPEAQTEDRHQPDRRGRSERRADDDPDRLREGDQSRADEADDGEDGRGGGLNHRREERPG